MTSPPPQHTTAGAARPREPAVRSDPAIPLQHEAEHGFELVNAGTMHSGECFARRLELDVPVLLDEGVHRVSRRQPGLRTP